MNKKTMTRGNESGDRRAFQGGWEVTGSKLKWTLLFAATIIIAFALSPFASPHPDGLERVAEDAGFLGKAITGFQWSPFPDYEIGAFSSNLLKVGLAGLVGVLVVACVLYGFGLIIANRSRSTHDDQSPS